MLVLRSLARGHGRLADAQRVHVGARAVREDEASGSRFDQRVSSFSVPVHGTASGGGLDIDTVWINGYGFSPRGGGPMFYVDTTGLSKICGTLQHFAVNFGSIWNLSALLEKLAKAPRTFASLDAGKA